MTLAVLVCEDGIPRKGENQERKISPKEEVFGTDTPRTSGGHSRGYPGPKLQSGQSKSWKNKHLGVDIHDPKARTSTTLRDFQKLRSEKLWAEFSFPSVFGKDSWTVQKHWGMAGIKARKRRNTHEFVRISITTESKQKGGL